MNLTSMRLVTSGVGLAAALFVATGPCLAQTATHSVTAVGPATGVTVNVTFFDGVSNVINGGTLAGQFSTVVNAVTGPGPNVTGTGPGTYASYCVDLYQVTGGPAAAQLSFESGMVSSVVAGGNVARNIGAAGWLFNNESSLFSTVLSGAANLTIKQAAMQLAIWEATFDTDFNVSAGNFKANDDPLGIRGYAQLLIDAAKDGSSYRTSTVVFVNFPPSLDIAKTGFHQDQIIAVPEPANLAAAFSALVLLGVGARVRRKV